ncbi:hypothetical protein TELCIR_12474 [Teladorsagia circumcincta]|uniref:PIN domain-containing protein n=1 Tax=Teladorsagia circumcincta TaxID=45464 RepID=A0A2G9U6M1_TELCI|nr:hypothetical protein TELCIR_12474 [Teladorsagia circumcincta]
MLGSRSSCFSWVQREGRSHSFTFYVDDISQTIPYITDCVMGELEKAGRRFKIALKVIKDNRFQRLKCDHKGTYADDCLVQRVTQHKCYIVATCDRDLKRRIRKIPGVPIMYILGHRFSIERMPDAYGAPQN